MKGSRPRLTLAQQPSYCSTRFFCRFLLKAFFGGLKPSEKGRLSCRGQVAFSLTRPLMGAPFNSRTNLSEVRTVNRRSYREPLTALFQRICTCKLIYIRCCETFDLITQDGNIRNGIFQLIDILAYLIRLCPIIFENYLFN